MPEQDPIGRLLFALERQQETPHWREEWHKHRHALPVGTVALGILGCSDTFREARGREEKTADCEGRQERPERSDALERQCRKLGMLGRQEREQVDDDLRNVV